MKFCHSQAKAVSYLLLDLIFHTFEAIILMKAHLSNCHIETEDNGKKKKEKLVEDKTCLG